MKIIIQVTAEKDGRMHYLNVDHIVYFTPTEDDKGTRIYFTGGEASHLVAQESPDRILGQIAHELEKHRTRAKSTF